jgi:hypothetical protein
MASERALYLFVFRIGLSENRSALFGPMLWFACGHGNGG